MRIKRPKKPPTVIEAAIAATSKIYTRHRPDFLGAREIALDKVSLEPFSEKRNAVRSATSQNGAFRSNAVQRKKRRIKFVKEHQRELFPPAA